MPEPEPEPTPDPELIIITPEALLAFNKRVTIAERNMASAAHRKNYAEAERLQNTIVGLKSAYRILTGTVWKDAE